VTSNYLTLCLVGGRYNTRALTTPTDGTAKTESGILFSPRGYFVILGDRAEDAASTPHTDSQGAFGSFSGNPGGTITQEHQYYESYDNQATEVVKNEYSSIASTRTYPSARPSTNAQPSRH